MRLAYDRRRRTGPEGIVELEPEGDVEGKTDRGPKSQAKEQRRTRGLHSICQSRAVSSLPPARPGRTPFAGGLGHCSPATFPVKAKGLRRVCTSLDRSRQVS